MPECPSRAVFGRLVRSSLRLASLIVATAFALANAGASPTAARGEAPDVPYFRDLAWTGEAYVGVATDGIQTSTDGGKWTVVRSSPEHAVHLVAVGNGRVVVAGDGVVFTARGAGAALEFTERSVPDAKFVKLAFGGGTFVALDAAGRAHVSDGASAWKVVSIAQNLEWKGVAFGDGVWIAVGNDDKTGAALYASKDPAGAWTRGTLPSDAGPYGIAYGKGQFLVVGHAGRVLTSPDGREWANSTSALLAGSNDITGVCATEDGFFVLGEHLFVRDEAGEWSVVLQLDATHLQTPIVRDGELHVVYQDENDVRAIVPVAEVEIRAAAVRGAWAEVDMGPEDAHFDVTVDSPQRITACEGATLHRFGVSLDTLYAATSKGLFKSTDGRTWERFGGITTPVDFVDASAEEIVIAGPEGLRIGRAADGTFAPVAQGRFHVRDLRNFGDEFVAIGDETKLVLGKGGNWREIRLEGVTRIVGLDVSRSSVPQVLAETATGVRLFWIDGESNSSEVTPLRSASNVRLADGLALLDTVSGITFGSIAEDGRLRHVDVAGVATAITPALDDGQWIVTSRGLIAGTRGEDLWRLHVAEGAVFSTVIDAGSSVIAGGEAGVVVLVPKPGSDVIEAAVLAASPVTDRAWNEKPVAASSEVHEPAAVATTPPVPSVAAAVAPAGATPAASPSAAEKFARAAADWDAGMTAAKTADERQQLCDTVLREWEYAHPNYTRDEALAWVNGVYARVIGYETNDHVISSFILGPSMFSDAFRKDFVAAMDPAQRALVGQIAADVVTDYEARWKPNDPGHPARVQPRATPVQPQQKPAGMDIAALRLRACGGDKLAAYDLSVCYREGCGVPLDTVAAEYWARRAQAAGFVFYTGATDTPEAMFVAVRTLAEQGSVTMQYSVARMCRDGTGTASDSTQAARWFERATAGGHWLAPAELAMLHLYGQGVPFDPAAALRIVEQAAASGSVTAFSMLGWFYEAGAGVPRDLARALGYYRKAVELGDHYDRVRVAEYLLAGHGTAKDEAAARVLLREGADAGDEESKKILAALDAGTYRPTQLDRFKPPSPGRPIFDVAARRARAEAGDPGACYDMGYIVNGGLGVIADEGESARWFAQAKTHGWKMPDAGNSPETVLAMWKAVADQGSLVGAFQYAVSIHNGSGAPADVELGTELLMKAAEAGHFGAQTEVGAIYEFGRGAVAKDTAKAFAWYKRAADGGDAFAQMKTGFAYDTGYGVPEDNAAAVRYFRLGAEGGNTVAMANLATLVTTGTGVAADPKAAAGWYLQIAGLENEPTEPDAAYATIKAEVADGNLRALAPLAIMTRRSFGVTKDANEAWALARAAEEFDVSIYPLSWFESDAALVKPAALRRSSHWIAEFMDRAMVSMAKTEGERAKALAESKALHEKTRAAAQGTRTSEVGQALSALEAGTATDAQITAVSKSIEPLRIYALEQLWQKAKTGTFPAGQPWTLRLAGLAEKPADASAAEKAFVTAALYTPDDDDVEGQARVVALRAIQVARLFYGVGTKTDLEGALAWATLNEAATDSYFPILFLASFLDPEELARADARTIGLQAQIQRQRADILALGNKGEAWMEAARSYRTLLQRAADMGDRVAAIEVAERREDGEYDVDKDPARAYVARLQAARLGDVESMFRAGYALVNGVGTEAKVVEGKAWIEKAAAAGDKNAAAVLVELAAADARAAQRTPPDKQVGPVDDADFKALTTLQNDATTVTLGQPAIVALLKATWSDADYSTVEEDLARELIDATARPLVVTGPAGVTLTFTKTVDASVSALFPQYLQGEFNVLNGEYYKQVWSSTGIAGVYLGGCHVSENGRALMNRILAEQLFEGVKFNASQGGTSFETLFSVLKASHDAAAPALQAEFRKEIKSAIGAIEAAGHSVPAAWKDLAWLK